MFLQISSELVKTQESARNSSASQSSDSGEDRLQPALYNAAARKFGIKWCAGGAEFRPIRGL